MGKALPIPNSANTQKVWSLDVFADTSTDIHYFVYCEWQKFGKWASSQLDKFL